MVPRGFLCSVCSTLFPAQDMLEEHIKLAHAPKLACKYCNATFTKVTTYI